MENTPNGRRQAINLDDLDAYLRERGEDVPERKPRKKRYSGPPEPHAIPTGKLFEERIAREEANLARAQERIDEFEEHDSSDDCREIPYAEVEAVLAEHRQKQVDDVDRKIAKKGLPWYKRLFKSKKKI